MKIDIECDFLTLEEVFEQLKPAIESKLLGEHEVCYGLGGFSWGYEAIEVEIVTNADDPRIGGKRTEYVDTCFIRENCEQYTTYNWAKDEHGDPVLLCLD